MSVVANLTNKINTSQQKYKHFIKYPASKSAISLVKLLFKQHLIRGFFLEKIKNQTFIFVLLKYGTQKKIFQTISLISKLNASKKSTEILKYSNGLGIYVISTSKGFITNYEATKLKLGGTFIIKIY